MVVCVELDYILYKCFPWMFPLIFFSFQSSIGCLWLIASSRLVEEISVLGRDNK